MNSILRRVIVALSGLFAVAMFFRLQITSGFDAVPGDIWDGRLLMGIVEHWRLVLLGEREWHTLAMFWPQEGSLGYSDTFFLTGMAYSLLRLFGLDQWHAYTAAYMGLGYAGYLSMYWLLRGFVRLPFLHSLLLAVLFVNVSPMIMGVNNSHMQLTYAWLLPCVIALGWKSLLDERRPLLWASLCALLLGLLFFSTFYVSWFFVLIVCIALFLFLAGGSVEGGIGKGPSRVDLRLGICRDRIDAVLRWAWGNRRRLLAFGAVFALLLLPFVWLYLPVLQESGPRSYRAMKPTMPVLVDFINVDPLNYTWGWIADSLKLHVRDFCGELRFGLPLLTLCTFFAAFVFFARRQLLGRHPDTLSRVAFAMSLAVLVCWLLSIKVGGNSLWWLVYTFVPGAKAIRCVFRINVVLTMFLLLVVAVYFRELVRGSRVAQAFAAILCVLMFAENMARLSPGYRISRRECLAMLAHAQPPPEDARVFYIKAPDCDYIIAHMEAFVLAQHFGLETVNGHSGLLPKSWPLDDVHSPAYEKNLLVWLKGELPKGLYAYDRPSGQWQDASALADLLDYREGEDLVAAHTFSSYDMGGWSGLEPWGAWTEGKLSSLLFSLPEEMKGRPLRMEAKLRALVSGSHSQRMTLRINGEKLGYWLITQENAPLLLNMEIPARLTGGGRLLLQLELPDATSPKTLGSGEDGRQLGVGVEMMRITGAE